MQLIGWGMAMDEFEELKPPHATKKLDQWNIEDLEAYIQRLQDEILAAEQAIKKKKNVSQAAEALFSSNT